MINDYLKKSGNYEEPFRKADYILHKSTIKGSESFRIYKSGEKLAYDDDFLKALKHACDVFGYDDSMVSDDRHGNCGCKYNKRTLEKIMRIHEQEMKEWLEQTRKDDELRRIKETMKPGIIKIAGI